MTTAKIIGLTGNIGSGKSTVAKLFALYGWPVFDSDQIGKLLIKENKEVQQKIIHVFGNEILTPNKLIDNSKLAAIVFNNETKLQALNNIIHPEVKKFFKKWHQSQNSPFVIRETALLFEAGIHSESFKNIVVTCSFDERIKRIQARNASSKEEIQRRENAQLPESVKIEKSDFVINNYDQPILPQVEKIKAALMHLNNG